MTTIRKLRAAALVTTAAFLAACGSDSSVAPDHPPADLGAVLSEMTLPSITSSFVPGAPALPSTTALTPSSCSYSATSQSFTCPTVSVSGITIARSFTLLNASGTPQSQFDPATTASVRTTSTTTGTVSSAGATITVDSQDELTLSGLLTGVHVLNGTSVTHMAGTDPGSATPFTMTMSATIANLVLPATATEQWPKSGQIRMDITDSMLGAAGTEHIAMTFNGTSKVLVTVTSGSFSFTCTVDLASQAPSCS